MMTARSEKFIECGRAGRPWGVRGELLVDWSTGSCPVQEGDGFVYLDERGSYRRMKVVASKVHGTRHVVQFEGVMSRDDAAELRGATFFLPEDELPELADGEYYNYQIIGLEVMTKDGDVIGCVENIFSTGNHDVYEVVSIKDGKRHEILIPAVDHVVVKIDLDARILVINPMKGLLD